MALAVKRMTDLELEEKRVLIREDLNVPDQGRPCDEHRADRGGAADAAARARRGRARAGDVAPRPARRKVSSTPRHRSRRSRAKLGELLGRDVPLARDWLDGVDVAPGDLVLCENVRFKKARRPTIRRLAKRMAALCDVFVMDAFGTAHRAQASTNGVARYAPVACAGPLLVAELEALAAALESPKRPLLAIVGGSKVSTKLEVLQSLSAKVDELILGGGIANTILAAAGRRGRQVVVRARHARLREATPRRRIRQGEDSAAGRRRRGEEPRAGVRGTIKGVRGVAATK